jgi:hypothetical protein
MKHSPRIAVALILAASALSRAHAAEEKPGTATDKKDRPQIQQFTYSVSYPFLDNKNPLNSSVSFLYAYENVGADSKADAYVETLGIVQKYLAALLESLRKPDEINPSLGKIIEIQETSGGTSTKPRLYSIRQAVDQSNKTKEYSIDIKYTRETSFLRPDGTRMVKKEVVKTEHQTFVLSGDAKSAKIELRCVNGDAVKLSDQLFSPH